MPVPSVWDKGVAAPSVTDPYQAAEAAQGYPGHPGGIGALAIGSSMGEPVAPPHRQIGGHWKEAFNPKSPAFWILLAILLFIGIMHIGAGLKVGKASVQLET